MQKTKAELLELKKEKETLREKLQATFHQINGQIILIEEWLNEIDSKVVMEKTPEPPQPK
jgi:hypothetical protein